MSDLGWRADGIARAKAAGGVELEVYTRPGFRGERAVRRSDVSGNVQGFHSGGYWEDDLEVDPSPQMWRKRG